MKSNLARLLSAYVVPGYTVGSRSHMIGEVDEDLEAEGIAEAVLIVLETRGVAISDALRQEISVCQDHDRLHRWLRQAALASSAEDLSSAY
jgi:TfoX/Sxy family transcriptional regulator of competence genes